MDKKDKYVHSMDWGEGEINLGDFKNYRKYQFDLIKKYIGKNILEVGSGDRSFTKEIFDNIKDLERIHSIEPSEVLFKMHEKNFQFSEKVTFECIDLFDLESDKTGVFDTAIFIHVLEHIEDDKKALDKVFDSIRPGGHVLIEVPALPGLYSVHDEILGHYRRYNKKMLRSIIDPDKYELLKLWYQDPIGVFGSYFFFKLRKIKIKSDEGMNLAKNQGGIYNKVVIPFEKCIEKVIRFPFGLSITAILKKK
ncbi:MAG: class I SAM-dependent methyltransferase [Bacteroidales bacterium]|nr:class I SAM-dependent methyltransferase [Bacteroidales bacterium]